MALNLLQLGVKATRKRERERERERERVWAEHGSRALFSLCSWQSRGGVL